MTESSKNLSRELSVSVPVDYVQQMIDCLVELSNAGEIRVSDSGLYSVFDVIENALGKGNPRQALATLGKTHSDTVHGLDSVKFPRKDGKKANAESPGTDLAGCIEIIWLLPGEFATKMRSLGSKYVAQQFVSRSAEESRKPKTDWTSASYALPISLEAAQLARFVADIAGCDQAMAAQLAVNAAIAVNPALAPARDEMKVAVAVTDTDDDALLNPTQIGKIIGLGARGVNLLLTEKDLQYKTEEKTHPYRPTEKGKEYSRMVPSAAKHNDQSIFQLRWRPSVVEILRDKTKLDSATLQSLLD